jgi:hypothetical protein
MSEEDSVVLAAPLAGAQAERRRLNQQVDARAESHVKLPTIGEVRHEVARRAANLKEILFSDVTYARPVLSQYIGTLVLVPTESVNGPAYEVLGDVDLFASGLSPKSGVMLEGSSTPTIQHYMSFGFAGIVVDPRIEGDDEDRPRSAVALRASLEELLKQQPDLQGNFLRASEWLSHLSGINAAGDSNNRRILDPKSMSQIVTAYEATLRKSLDVNILTDRHTYARHPA